MMKRLILMAAFVAGAWAQDSPPSAAPALSEQKIGPDDLISISVFDEPALTKPAIRIGSDGAIALPLLPNRLHLAGLLPREAEAAIARQLIDQQILIHPVVTVSLLEITPRVVSVVGDVGNPGELELTGPTTLLDALTKAGWVTPEAAGELLYRKTATDPPRKINIAQLAAGADETQNVILSGGEVIVVPEAPKIWITGAHPQSLPLQDPDNATVLKIVTKVEGEKANFAKTAFIYRADGTGARREIEVPLADIMRHKAKDVPLQADDILMIPWDDSPDPRKKKDQVLPNTDLDKAKTKPSKAAKSPAP